MTTRAGLVLIALAAALALTALAPRDSAAKAVRPDPLVVPNTADCERYVGATIGANDETQRFELIVCADPAATQPNQVKTIVQTSSLVSGWSKRSGTGTWDAEGKTLRMADAAFLDNRPEPDWMFCLIEEAVLERSASGLTGYYVATACEDRADLKLERVAADAPLVEPGGSASEAVGPAPANEPERAPAPEPPPASTDPRPPAEAPRAAEQEPPSRGCACGIASNAGPSGWGLLGALGLLGLARRRRAAGRGR